MMKPMNRRVAVRGVVVKDGKLLAARLKKYAGRATGSEQDTDYWCTPGGGVDVGESLLIALEREMIEELGVKPIVGRLLYVQQFVHGDTEQIEFFFHVTNTADYADVDLSKTSHGAIEIETVDFVDPRTERVLPQFLASEPLDDASLAVATTKIFNYIP
jgi:ADP-ribose pyrophosphatase YjhB (NUDIX family)